ncbi:hypothetical protein [Kocuria rosea]|uniref:hypothetical protein n=1 Tax=Kocuria rosea TaxID=1275 RepID=UPI000D647F67|nr:hypothetical protein [Kocuria rosea]PWF83625.1 hypothetical protein DEJ37_13995 [Kocuria rosea]PWF88113.1 hypothetical protein CIK52_02155 [Kocuria rosea]QCY32540.1 hypothetical protein EQG70_06305 [Kocuria rosea]TQN34580.1 hypothetical protein FHX38_2683 [Kocuria rosea]STX02575.1 Uncharacterised protein [Kocuria rosea]
MSPNPPQNVHQKPPIGRLGLVALSLALVTGCTTSDSGGIDEPDASPSASSSPTTGATGSAEATQPAPSPTPSTTPGATPPPMPGALPDQDFTYDEAYAAWQDGMPYYDAFCIHYEPVTPAGVSQCEGIENGTVDSITGEPLGQ